MTGLAIGATGSWRRRDGSGCQPVASSTTQAGLTRWPARHTSGQWKRYRTKRWYFCCPAAIARPTCDVAWSLFGQTPPGWGRVQAICDYVHDHITFGYEHACATRTAWEAHRDHAGVCRDFAHLAIAFCRCLNIPARYCTGYLGDIGVPASDLSMDFSAWFEAYLDDAWYTFDARHNVPRIGRVLIARGRDAADVAITTAFGANRLSSFSVQTEEVAAA